jgi:GDP-L-fucose synthase
MERYSGEGIMNVGAGKDIPIAELAAFVAEVVGYRGEIQWDRTKPDGTPRKLMDNTRMAELGWSPTISLRQGLQQTYDWYRAQGTSVYVGKPSV